MMKKKLANWWYYYKWYVICGGILLWILIDVVGSALGLREKKPDFEIAYVGGTPLPDDTAAALEQGFAQLGGDFNGDGETIVRVNQYINSSQAAAPELSARAYASEIVLMGDISSCESYFFLTDDPESLQRSSQILAAPDGSCPEETDYSAEDKVVLWSETPALREMELGSYSFSSAGATASGDSQELLSGLYLGRRCFYTDKTVASCGQCNDLWHKITGAKDVQAQIQMR